MKVLSIIFVGSLGLQSVAAILSGQVVPQNTKTYTTCVRTAPDGDSYCSGALISPMHVLTTALCANDDVGFAVVGTHYRKGAKDGEPIKVVSVDKHPNFDEVSLAYNFAVLTLAKPSKFEPVQLPREDSYINAGKWALSMGWGITTNSLLAAVSNELRSVKVEVWNKEACEKAFGVQQVSDSLVCAGGEERKGVCIAWRPVDFRE